jgi:hypothetical protein
MTKLKYLTSAHSIAAGWEILKNAMALESWIIVVKWCLLMLQLQKSSNKSLLVILIINLAPLWSCGGLIKGILLQLVMVTTATVLFVAIEHVCHGYKVRCEHVIVHLMIKKNKHFTYRLWQHKRGQQHSHYKKISNLRKFQQINTSVCHLTFCVFRFCKHIHQAALSHH